MLVVDNNNKVLSTLYVLIHVALKYSHSVGSLFTLENPRLGWSENIGPAKDFPGDSSQDGYIVLLSDAGDHVLYWRIPTIAPVYV